MRTFNAVLWALSLHDFMTAVAPYIKAWIVK
jgi:hypothetical protein